MRADDAIVVGVDGTSAGLAALDWAAGEATRRHVPLRLVHVVRDRAHDLELVPRTDAEEGYVRLDPVLAAARERVAATAPDVQLTDATETGDAVSALVRQSRTACVLVVGSNARHHARSMTARLRRRACCPIVVVPHMPQV